LEQTPHSLEAQGNNHDCSSPPARTRVADTLRQQQDVGGLKNAKRDNR
jgi:hypothetical protein